jgi:hypothetical protein
MIMSIGPPSNGSDSDTEIELGTAGASARREHQRQPANREKRARERQPRIGGLLFALQDEPQHQHAWAPRASGAEQVARRLAELVNDRAILLHERRIPGSLANIDHIAIAPAGVWVIDAKRYNGRLTIDRSPLGKAKLKIAGSDRTRLIHGLTTQVSLVDAAVARIAPGVPVRGVLCFVDADLPWAWTLSMAGHELLYPRALAKRLNRGGPVDVQVVARELVSRFAAA